MSQFRPVDCKELVQVAPGFSARFWDAGHILGSAAIEVRAEEDGREISLDFLRGPGRLESARCPGSGRFQAVSTG